MPCFHPLSAWYGGINPQTGKSAVVFRPLDSLKANARFYQLTLPCGHCVGCRLEKAKEWAVRCTHESKLYDCSLFVTLSYRESALHWNSAGRMTLDPRDMVLFLKRLRHVKPGVRFFQCGEYGSRSERPHHHAILFGCNFSDRRFHKTVAAGRLDVSKELDALWGHGDCYIGTATFESAGYIARYTMKKVGNPVDPLDKRFPEYLTMSRRPGIGRVWAERYWRDWYADDYLIVDGRKVKPPRYYDSIVDKLAPLQLRRVKYERRCKQAEASAADWAHMFEFCGGSRNVVREEVVKSRIAALQRDLEAS